MSEKVYGKKNHLIRLYKSTGTTVRLITYICAVTLFKAFEHIYLVVLVSEMRPGPQVKILFFILNPTEDGIYHAHK